MNQILWVKTNNLYLYVLCIEICKIYLLFQYTKPIEEEEPPPRPPPAPASPPHVPHPALTTHSVSNVVNPLDIPENQTAYETVTV